MRSDARSKPTWKTFPGPEINIEGLSTQHLANIIMMLAVGKGKEIETVSTWPALRAEAIKRGLYPAGLKGGILRFSITEPDSPQHSAGMHCGGPRD